MSKSKQKRIIIFSSYAPSLTNFRGDMIKAMLAENYEILCLSSEVDSVTPFKVLNQWRVKTKTIPLQRTGMNPIQDIRTLIALWRIISYFKPSIIFSYTIKPVLYGSLLSFFFAGTTHISMITGMPSLLSKLSGNSPLNHMLSKLFTANKYIIFQNEDDEAAFSIWKYLERARPVRTHGSGVNLNQFEYKKILPHAKIRFLLIARLLHDKGIIEYLKAAQIVTSKYANAEFSVVGWFDEKNPNGVSREEFSEYVNEQNIVFLGRLDDVRESIELHDIYVLPSYHEGTPRTVLEAMAIGRPIITTNVPGCKETVDHGYNGYLVPAKGVIELAEAMEKFIIDPDSIRIMGGHSRELAERKFDVKMVNTTIMDILNRC